jgi:hypothetical protein
MALPLLYALLLYASARVLCAVGSAPRWFICTFFASVTAGPPLFACAFMPRCRCGWFGRRAWMRGFACGSPARLLATRTAAA